MFIRLMEFIRLLAFRRCDASRQPIYNNSPAHVKHRQHQWGRLGTAWQGEPRRCHATQQASFRRGFLSSRVKSIEGLGCRGLRVLCG